MAFLTDFLQSKLRRRRRAAIIESRGPVFISYRHSDGVDVAVGLAWALRAAGVPVWHDQTDLPPGDTTRRLEEALASGLSGAVLLVTPEIEHSDVVRTVELPRLLELEKDDMFTLAIGSVVELAEGKLDYEAPDRLLRQRRGTLSRLDQQPVRAVKERAQLARAQARRRMEGVKHDVLAGGRVLTLDVQTRLPPFATKPDADLVLRLRPPVDGDRRPHRDGLHDLAQFLGTLPELLAVAGADHLKVRGGAHLSVAYALGAALPTTVIGRVEVVDTGGATWMLQGNAPSPTNGDRLLEVIGSGGEEQESGLPCVVYLDLVPVRSDGAFKDLLLALGPRTRYVHVRPATEGALEAASADVIVGEASHLVRDWASRAAGGDMHLLLRCPWGIAFLLGRTLNTVRVRLYEWEDGPDDAGTIIPPRYLPSLVVRSGAGGSPIESVLLPARIAP